MSLSYSNPRFHLLYPEGWTLDETRGEEGLTMNLQSPYSMFLFLTLYESPAVPQSIADQALGTMSEEYEGLDASPISDTIADLLAVGHDINFFSLDMTNTCWIRAFSCDDCSVLIFAQTNDLDLERSELAFRGICASLKMSKPPVLP